MQSLDVPTNTYLTFEVFMDRRLRMLTNHEIVVSDEAQLIGALDFLLQKRRHFKELYFFDDRVNYHVYKETANLSKTKFDCLKMIEKLSYTGSVSLDFTLSKYAEIFPYDITEMYPHLKNSCGPISFYDQ